MESMVGDLALVLAALGNSAKEVAAGIKAQRIKGVRNTARFLNPICRYVEVALTLDPLTVDVMDHGTLCIACPDGTTLKAPLPQPIKDFLDAFNRGTYPEIEKPPS